MAAMDRIWVVPHFLVDFMFHDTIAHVTHIAMAMGWNAKQEVWIPTVHVEQKSTVTAAIDKSAALWRRVLPPRGRGRAKEGGNHAGPGVGTGMGKADFSMENHHILIGN